MLDLRRLRLLHELHRLGTVERRRRRAVLQPVHRLPAAARPRARGRHRRCSSPPAAACGSPTRRSCSPSTPSACSRAPSAPRPTSPPPPRAPSTGVVRVGSFQTASLRLLLPAMNALRDDAPRRPGAARRGRARARPRGAALARARPRRSPTSGRARRTRGWPGLDREDLFTEPLHVALPSAHPLARGGAIRSRSAALAGEAWATGYPGGGMAALVRRVCNEHGGFEPDVRHRDQRAHDAARARRRRPRRHAAAGPRARRRHRRRRGPADRRHAS